jgi:hypothetical protein
LKQIPLYYCPTRRSPEGVSLDRDNGGDYSTTVARKAGALGDYAAVAGDGTKSDVNNLGGTMYSATNGPMVHSGPYGFAKIDPHCLGVYPNWRRKAAATQMIRIKHVTDGMSKTAFMGERHVPAGLLGRFAGGDTSIYNSDHRDACCARAGGPAYPLAASPTESYKANFGSSHPGITQFVFGDGSVRVLNVEISATVLGYLCVRNDGKTVTEEMLP